MFSNGRGTPVDYLRCGWGQAEVAVRADTRKIGVFRQKVMVALRGVDFQDVFTQVERGLAVYGIECRDAGPPAGASAGVRFREKGI